MKNRTRLDEEINLRDVFKARKFSGKKRDFGKFSIDPKAVDTFKHKDIIKSHGGRWFKDPNTSTSEWSFTDYKDDPTELLQNSIKPTLEEIAKVEGNNPEEVVAVLDFLRQEWDTVMAGGEGRAMTGEVIGGTHADPEEIKGKIDSLKAKFLSITSSEEFKEAMRPILKFRSAQGMQYSFVNTILILLQDPEATFVQSIGRWQKAGREVIPNAKIIGMWLPINKPMNRMEKEEITKKFLEKCGVASVEELDKIQRMKLQAKLARGTPTGKFKWANKWVDIRFTKTVNGEKDEFDEIMAGREALGKMKWYDDSGNATQKTIDLVNAIELVCQEHGIKVEAASKEELRGARGYSAIGGKKIAMMDGAEQNEDYLKTMVHELTHSLCHWKDSKFPLKDEYAIQEQEAELTAWIVLMNYGYETVTDTSMNYIGGWGLTEENAAKVFDTMAKVADYIVQEVNKKLERRDVGVSESVLGRIAGAVKGTAGRIAEFIKRKLSGGGLTGRDLAKAFGMERLYLRSKSMEGRDMHEDDADDEAMMGRLQDEDDIEGNDEMPEYGLS